MRSRQGPSGEGGALDQYVNDRPYAASSFLSVAMTDVFRSAIAGKCAARPELVGKEMYLIVDTTIPDEEKKAIDWWLDLTANGGEGMVVKALEFAPRGKRGLAQPAVKCRGREYLRIIYGPEYTLPENLERLRRRGLRAKRSLAIREFALGVEPLRRVHECVFGVLALESEPIDPRL